MWGQIAGENKIVIARRVLKDVIGTLDEQSEIGLIAYGHRKKGDCADIETVVPLERIQKASLAQQIDSFDPKGKTPITKSIHQAIETARSREDATTIVFVSDGIETAVEIPVRLSEKPRPRA